MQNHFNLVDEPWIPIADHGLVSLKEVFSNTQYRSLGGNPVQKIALLKLLLAVAQSAATPANESEWRDLGSEGLAQRCLAYLDRWYERFYLYGDRPFLQIPAVSDLIDARTRKKVAETKSAAKKAEAILSGRPKKLGAAFYPDMPSLNCTVLSHTLIDRVLTDAEKAIFLVSLMNFAFAGKRVEADMTSLGGRPMGSRYSAPAGPSLGGWNGQLHSFLHTGSIQSDVWLNLLSTAQIESLKVWPTGIGKPIWELMPNAENDDITEEYKYSYLSTLVSLSRFTLLSDSGIYYLDGINYPSIKNGWYEPSLLLDHSGVQVRTKYADPARKPWRELDGLLAFLDGSSAQGFNCFTLSNMLNRARDNFCEFSIWIGGLKVTSNTGDQSVKQSDDFVESQVWLEGEALGEAWLAQLKIEMAQLNSLSDGLKHAVKDYFKIFSNWKKGDKEPPLVRSMGESSTSMFWQLCESDFQTLVDNCEQTDIAVMQRRKIRKRFAGFVQQAYDQFCPRETARQLDAWAKCRPNNSNYLKQEA